MNNNRGFTLVELMISALILFIVTMAVQQVFVMTIKMWRKGDARLQMYQDGRFALEMLSTRLRSTVRPGHVDWNRNGLYDAPDVSVTGCRFVGINYAGQTTLANTGILTAATQGINYGYKESDAIGFFSMGYSTAYNESEISGWIFGCGNATGSLLGVPAIYSERRIANSTAEAAGNYRYLGALNDADVSQRLTPQYSTIGLAGKEPSFYSVQNLNFEYFDASTPPVSGSGVMFWDSAGTGEIPAVVKVMVEVQDERGIEQPQWVVTYVNLISQGGL